MIEIPIRSTVRMSMLLKLVKDVELMIVLILTNMAPPYCSCGLSMAMSMLMRSLMLSGPR